MHRHSPSLCFFFFNDTATTEIYTLSLHDALPISPKVGLSRKQVGNPPKRGLALAEGGTEASNRDPPAQAALGLLPHGDPGLAGRRSGDSHQWAGARHARVAG